MAHPLSAVPTAFRVETRRGSYYGNCVWDALGIPAMLGVDARIETACPDCDEEIVFVVRNGELEPVEAVAHFAVPAARWWDDIGHT
jgi:Alkylmercury lyase